MYVDSCFPRAGRDVIQQCLDVVLDDVIPWFDARDVRVNVSLSVARGGELSNFPTRGNRK